jgi:hypothetical protein
MPVLQPIYRKGTRSNNQVRNLIAATSIAPHILTSTIEDTRFGDKQIVFCRAHETTTLANITVKAGGHFYLVASKFFTLTEENGEFKKNRRYYIVARVAGAWKCSASEAKVAAKCISQEKAAVEELPSLIFS